MRIGPSAGSDRACPRSRAVTASQSIRGRWQRSSGCPSARSIQFARCRKSCRRARPSEFRRGPRARRFRPEPQQRSTREWLSASFPARAPEAASSPSPPRPDSHWPGRRKPRSTGSAGKRAPPGEAAEALGMLPTVAGAAVRKSDVDAVFRTPSILPPDLASAIGGEGASFWAIWSTPSRFATSGQFSAPAHPSAKLAASAIVASRTGRARSPYGSRSTRTSSRLRLKTSGRPAGFLGNDQM